MSVFIVKNKIEGIFAIVSNEDNAIKLVSMLNKNEIDRWNKVLPNEPIMCINELSDYLIWEFIEQK